MPREDSSPSGVVFQIREMLGLSGEESGSGFAGLSLEALQRHTRRQLLECARRLGLTGLDRLTKEAIAKRFQVALQGLGVSPEPREPAANAEEPADLPRKFDLGRPAETRTETEHIPWGYGQDRVTAMVVDPDRLYVYWEVTDEAIERARGGLGPAGRDAWLNLRVYDVTNRIFDGTNAHSYLDHEVARTDRQWFFHIGKPGSTACAELGVKSLEGYFVRIARSGRADFPRREPAPSGEAEWLTVRTATGEVGQPVSGGPSSAFIPDGGALATHLAPARTWDIRRTHAAAEGEWIVRAYHWGWEEVFHGAWTGERDTFAWEGPVIRTSWEAGPFSFPVEPPAYVEEWHSGRVAVHSAHGRTHIVYGPWQVIIRGLGARAERQVLAIWEMHRSWTASAGFEVHAASRRELGPGGSERLALGASERRRSAASELRLGGASEIHRLGASELRYLGASETLYAGASEWRPKGASERLYAGASERRFRGASEMQRGGASEISFAYPGGASESLPLPPRR